MNIAIEQIQHGNEQAFKSLFDEYYQGLCVFASAYLKDDDLSADVVQEAFVKFWNRRRDFDHIVKIKSFLYTIVRNDCLNIVQRQKVSRRDLQYCPSDSMLLSSSLVIVSPLETLREMLSAYSPSCDRN